MWRVPGIGWAPASATKYLRHSSTVPCHTPPRRRHFRLQLAIVQVMFLALVGALKYRTIGLECAQMAAGVALLVVHLLLLALLLSGLVAGRGWSGALALLWRQWWGVSGG